MLLEPAAESDFGEIVDLANMAYRGTSGAESWSSEASVIEGQRLDESLLREQCTVSPEARMLIYRDEGGAILGMVWLDPKADGVWYLGLLTVRPDQQERHLGSALLAAAEDYARVRAGLRIRMTVVHVRSALIAWYERRGYALTGETEPFPYGDERFGRPLRDDLYFVVLEKEIRAGEILD
jgi:ribosomal protein S18 acetylase RimI-like enzyme